MTAWTGALAVRGFAQPPRRHPKRLSRAFSACGRQFATHTTGCFLSVRLFRVLFHRSRQLLLHVLMSASSRFFASRVHLQIATIHLNMRIVHAKFGSIALAVILWHMHVSYRFVCLQTGSLESTIGEPLRASEFQLLFILFRVLLFPVQLTTYATSYKGGS